MPFPLIPVLIVLAVLAGGGTLAVAIIKWDDIVIALKGKKIAVLGERLVGKTHLIEFLTTGSIPETYRMTIHNFYKRRRFKLRELNLVIKDVEDFGGTKEVYGKWKKEVKKADLVFYLLRTDKLMAGNSRTEQRVLEDMKHIGRWICERRKRPDFYIIGTFCDLDPEFKKITKETIGLYNDKFRQLPVIKKIIAELGGEQYVNIALGSMKNKAYTERLVFGLFSQINRRYHEQDYGVMGTGD